jgi:hypothetical protein
MATSKLLQAYRSRLQSDLTLPITRRPGPLPEHESRRVGGRVHWLVRVRDRDMTPRPPPTEHGATRLPRRPAEDNPKRGPRDGNRAHAGREPRAVASRKPPLWFKKT